MTRLKLKFVVKVALLNLLTELILSKSTNNELSNRKIVKLKKILKRIQEYRKTPLILSIFLVILSTLKSHNYGNFVVPNKKVGDIDLIFS